MILTQLENFLDNFNLYNKVYLIIGDINIDMILNSNVSRKTKNIFNSFNFKLLNKQPTRISNNKSSLIDVIFSNNNLKNSNFEIETLRCSFSDHNAILCSNKKFKLDSTNKSTVSYRNYSKILNQNNFNSISKIIINCTNFEDLINNSNKILDILAPTKNKIVNEKKNNLWINKEIMCFINEKKKAFNNNL